ncbi:MAG: DMT family transporter [Cyanobacteria bacterium]|nr:DMT family transporter [Cyanobacteriota bacterium]
MKPQHGLELVILAALWGGSFLFMRIAAPELGPIWLSECRVLLAGLVLLPLVIRRGLWPELRRHARPLMVVGFLNSALPFSLLAFASLSLPAGMTSILNGTVPFFGVVVAFFWLKEPLTLARVMGLILGFTGVVVLVGLRETTVTSGLLLAVAAGMVAAIAYAVSAPYVRMRLQGVPALVIATGTLLSAASCLVPLLPFTRPQQVPQPLAMGAVVALALFSTAVAYLIYFHLIEQVGPTRTLTVAYLIPLFAIAWGTLLLDEPLTQSMILGCGLILLGTAIANTTRQRSA